MGYFDSVATSFIPLPSDPRNNKLVPPFQRDSIPGFWVEIKDELDFGDVNYRNKQVLRLESVGLQDAGDATAKWQIEMFGAATLERAIVSWNLTEGAPTPAEILHLRARDAQHILAEVLKSNPIGDDLAGKVEDSAATTKRSRGGKAASQK